MINILIALLLVVWFLASIMWGSVWFNLVTADKEAKQQFLDEKARSAADRLGVGILRFPVVHLLIWFANIVLLCWAATRWWQS